MGEIKLFQICYEGDLTLDVSHAMRRLGAEPGHPTVGALPGDPHLLGHVRGRAPLDTDPLHQQAAAEVGQAGVSVRQRGPPGRVGCLDTTHRIGGLRLDQAGAPTVTNVLAGYS